jgi:hypothetical protein
MLPLSLCAGSAAFAAVTRPLWVSKVGNAEFRHALTTSLTDAGLISPPDSCKFSIDVNLLGRSQPSAGFAMEVTSHANYKVYNGAGGPVLLATISAAYTAQFSEAFVGIVRLQRANEGAVRESIAQFMERLRQVQITSPGPDTPPGQREADPTRSRTTPVAADHRQRDAMQRGV